MPDIPITDNLSASANLKLAEDSPLAKAQLAHLLTDAKSFAAEFQEPIDRAQFRTASLGFTVNSPSELIGNLTTLTLKAGMNGGLSVLKPADQALFPDDGFVPVIPIAPDECWVGVALEATTGVSGSPSVNGFGVGFAVKSSVKAGTYSRFRSAAGTFPGLKSCLEEALNNYRVLHTPETIRTQKPGTVLVAETSGTVKFAGSYTLPVNVSALASANLPFNYNVSVNPNLTMAVSGEIALSGSFHIRCIRLAEDTVQLALYKEKGTELAVGFTAGAGLIATSSGQTDLIASVLGAVLPSVDAKQAGILGDKPDAIRDVLKKSIDRCLAISFNARCSADFVHELAVAYVIHLNEGDASITDAALATALAGDWTKLAALSNAKCLRNIVIDTNEHANRINVNLLGFYNASSVNDYLKSSTILHDENGQLFFIDKASASRIATAATPYLADTERLSKVLEEVSVASITYAATTASIGTQLKIRQQYLRYDKNMNQQSMQGELLLARALGMAVSEWSSSLPGTGDLGHVRVYALADYDSHAALSVFLADSRLRTPRSKAELTQIGRETLAALIVPAGAESQTRRSVLANDTIWAEMDKQGSMSSFSSIPELSRLSATEVADVAADWASVRWWANSVFQLAPKLIDVLNTADQLSAADLKANQLLTKKRATLLEALKQVTASTHAALNEGWGMAVMYALAQAKPTASMDITRASKPQHFVNAPQLAAAGASGP